MQLRIDLHCHTLASYDCKTSLEAVVLACQHNKIDVLAITDHNEIWAAQKLAALGLANPQFIVGEEVYTNQGEIIGLFLQEKIARGQSPEHTLAEIHEQGGLALLPHGFDHLKPSTLKAVARERIKASLDIIEAFNGHTAQARSNHHALVWATSHGLPISGGSDAHRAADIGSVYLETTDTIIKTPMDLLAALKVGKIIGRRRNPILSFLREQFPA